nr:LysR substrate-binding domain-containing protein [Mesorhizobium atlanticum]
MDRFRQSCPDVSLAIEDIPREQCLTAVCRRRLDIVIAPEIGPVTSCRTEILWQERVFVLLPAGHPLAEKQVVTWTDLAGMQLLVRVAASGPLLHFAVLESMVADGCRPAVKLGQAGLASIVFNPRHCSGWRKLRANRRNRCDGMETS